MRIDVKYGLYIGILNFVWLLLEYISGLHGKYIEYHSIVTWFWIVIPIVGYILMYRKLKSLDPDGYLKFSTTIKSGLVAAGITAIIAIPSQTLYFFVINPGWTDFMVEQARLKIMATTSDPGEIESAVLAAKSYFSYVSYLIQNVAGSLFIGFALSIFIGVFMKKEKPKIPPIEVLKKLEEEQKDR